MDKLDPRPQPGPAISAVSLVIGFFVFAVTKVVGTVSEYAVGALFLWLAYGLFMMPHIFFKCVAAFLAVRTLSLAVYRTETAITIRESQPRETTPVRKNPAMWG